MDRRVQKALADSAKKITRKVDVSVVKRFPHSGGLAKTMLSAMRYQARIHAKGMELKAWAVGKRGPRELPEMNRGRIRHPLFGNRDHWYVTRIRPGVVSDPLRNEAPRILAKELEKALNATADYIEGK